MYFWAYMTRVCVCEHLGQAYEPKSRIGKPKDDLKKKAYRREAETVGQNGE